MGIILFVVGWLLDSVVIIIIGATWMITYVVNQSITNKKEQQTGSTDPTEAKAKPENEEQQKQQLMKRLCRDVQLLNCEIIDSNDNSELVVKYQGEAFSIRPSSGNSFVIFDLCWYSLPLNDNVDNVSMVMKTVNESNRYEVPTIFYIKDTERDVMAIHSKYDCLDYDLHADHPAYIRTLLNYMFSAHHIFFHIMEDNRQEEYARNVR